MPKSKQHETIDVTKVPSNEKTITENSFWGEKSQDNDASHVRLINDPSEERIKTSVLDQTNFGDEFEDVTEKAKY